MSRLLLGSINLTELSAKIKSGEIDVFTSEKSGVKYVNVAVFVNDAPNQYGQIASISHKNKTTGATTNLGNFKENGAGGGAPINNVPKVNKDDLDFLND